MPPVSDSLNEPAGDACASGDDGGPRRQPELSESIPDTHASQPAVGDLTVLDDDAWSAPAQLDSGLQRNARLAELDPDDGIPL